MKKPILFLGLIAILTACTAEGTKEETLSTDSTAVAVDTTCIDTACVATPTVAVDSCK